MAFRWPVANSWPAAFTASVLWNSPDSTKPLAADMDISQPLYGATINADRPGSNEGEARIQEEIVVVESTKGAAFVQ